jgi:hypothetical protein
MGRPGEDQPGDDPSQPSPALSLPLSLSGGAHMSALSSPPISLLFLSVTGNAGDYSRAITAH